MKLSLFEGLLNLATMIGLQLVQERRVTQDSILSLLVLRLVFLLILAAAQGIPVSRWRVV